VPLEENNFLSFLSIFGLIDRRAPGKVSQLFLDIQLAPIFSDASALNKPYINDLQQALGE